MLAARHDDDDEDIGVVWILLYFKCTPVLKCFDCVLILS